MRSIYLLRHADASAGEPGADHERPLNDRGDAAAADLARHFADAGIEPSLILCSSALRARQTMDGLRGGLRPGVEVAIEEDLYLAEAVELLGRLRRIDDAVTSVLMIAHNPAIQELVLALSGRGERLEDAQGRFPSAALATITFDGTWSELAIGAGKLSALVLPQELAARRNSP